MEPSLRRVQRGQRLVVQVRRRCQDSQRAQQTQQHPYPRLGCDGTRQAEERFLPTAAR